MGWFQPIKAMQHLLMNRFIVMACSIHFSYAANALELPTEYLSQLRSEEFKVREKAQTDLLAWARSQGLAATDELYRLSRESDDPEVRDRCLGVLRKLVNDEYLRDGEGYIGIQMQEELANVPGDPKPRGVIRVMMIMPDSPGHRAGLQFNDLIAGVGDEVWREESVLLLFREKIKQFKPETKILLKVLRNGNLMDLEVKLGRRPPLADNPFFGGNQQDLDAAEAAAKDAYFRRWLDRRKARK